MVGCNFFIDMYFKSEMPFNIPILMGYNRDEMNFQAELHIRNFGDKEDLSENDRIKDLFLLDNDCHSERVKNFYFGEKVCSLI